MAAARSTPLTNSTVRVSISSLSQSRVATWKLRSSITCSTGPLARATSIWLEAGSTTWSWTLVKTRTGHVTDSSSASTSAAAANSESVARNGSPG